MKNLTIILILFLILVGTGCASSETAVTTDNSEAAVTAGNDETAVTTDDSETAVTETTNDSSDEPVRLNEDYNDASPIMTQLAAGTLQLEETDLAVDETLAAEILPLWQAVQSLSNSETAASVEIEAVLNQIQDTMAPEQVTAIANMEITSDTLAELLESGDIAFGPGGGRTRSNEESGEGFAPPAGGQGSGFGSPGGGGQGQGGLGGPQAGGELSEDDIATRQAEFASGDGFAEIQDQAMVGAVVRLLQTKTGEAPERPQAGVNDVVLTAVSETLGLTLEELLAELAEADSLLAVIEAHGGDETAVREAIITSLNALPNAAELDVEQIADNWLSE